MILDAIETYYNNLKSNNNENITTNEIDRHIQRFVSKFTSLSFFKSTQRSHEIIVLFSTCRCFTYIDYKFDYGCCFTKLKTDLIQISLTNCINGDNIETNTIICQRHFLSILQALNIISNWQIYCEMHSVYDRSIDNLLKSIKDSIDYLNFISAILKDN